MFAAGAAFAEGWCGSSRAMPGMDMPGGWVMSMAWIRVPGQGWLEYISTFLGMWAVMMAAMMAPVFAPALLRYRRAVRAGGRGLLSCCVAAGYFTPWMVLGAVLLPSGMAFAQWAIRVPAVSEAVPMARALTVMLAGAAQFTAWKASTLACCRQPVECCGDVAPGCRFAWRHGLGLGLRCVHCCAGFTAALLAVGIMDLRAMALVTLAITAERLAPWRKVAAHGAGAVLVAAGAWMMSTALAR